MKDIEPAVDQNFLGASLRSPIAMSRDCMRLSRPGLESLEVSLAPSSLFHHPTPIEINPKHKQTPHLLPR
jgi:hypothetical protein